MTSLKRVCVFIGSSPGSRPDYSSAAEAMGQTLADQGVGLVYGGASVGLMGVVADAALAAGGEVIGVIPQHLVDREVAHTGLSDLRIVDSMHERKALMSELADGFVALPGGFGTLEEYVEMLTWAQLGLHAKPCGLLDVAGFYEPLLAFLDHATAERFVNPQHRSLVIADTDPQALLDAMSVWAPGTGEKWLQRG